MTFKRKLVMAAVLLLLLVAAVFPALLAGTITTTSWAQQPTVPREVSEDASFTLQNFTVAGSGTLSVTITLTENGSAPASGSFTLGTKTGLTFQTGDGAAVVGEVQPAGSRRMTPVAMVAGRRLSVGDVLCRGPVGED